MPPGQVLLPNNVMAETMRTAAVGSVLLSAAVITVPFFLIVYGPEGWGRGAGRAQRALRAQLSTFQTSVTTSW